MSFRTHRKPSRYLPELDPETLAALRSVESQVAHLHDVFDLWQELGRTPERVRSLNFAGAHFFGRYQSLLLHETILGICRITDPVRKKSREASLPWILSRVCIAPRTEHDRLNRSMSRLQGAVKPFRIFRNKVRAHADLDHYAGVISPQPHDLHRLHQAVKLTAGITMRIAYRTRYQSWGIGPTLWCEDIDRLTDIIKTGTASVQQQH